MSSDLAAPLPGLILAASLGLNAGLAVLARRVGWCDPVGIPLKTHRQPVPLTGGIALLSVLAAVCGIIGRGKLWYILAGVAALIAGLFDDIYWKRRSPSAATHVFPKLALQTCAALAAIFSARINGIRLAFPLPAVAAFMLVAMNAFNLEDGMDGLCAGEAALSCLGFAVVFYRSGYLTDSLIALLLSIALAGFVLLNWHPAEVFLGDSGSHMLGMLIACFGLTTMMRPPAVVSHSVSLRLAAGTVLLTGMPLPGLIFVIVRRLLRRRHMFAGDREHLYDILHQHGIPVPQVTLLLLVIQSFSVIAGILLLGGSSG
ncbi:MAG: MraY family glycosyltransferase [candidate division WOR-3 bacterium]